MLTKSTKTVTKTIEVEVETFNLELTKDQLIELAGLLGNCSSKKSFGGNLYFTIYDTLKDDQKLIDSICMKFGEDFEGVPQLQYL